MEKFVYKEDFDVNKIIKIAEEYYPKFYDEFILSFNNKEVMETSIKLAINIENDKYTKYNILNSYIKNYYSCHYNYYNMVRDLAINYGIYKDEKEMEKDYYDIRSLEIEFLNFYCNLKRRNKKLYLALRKKGITDKQMYDECFISSDGKHINYDINKLVKKYEDILK